MSIAVEMRNITKRFPGVIANNRVNFKASWGQIHGLIGENGAGKTTLMKILYGMYQPDEGNIYINSKLSNFANPKEAIKSGIGMVHQHFTLVPSITVAENIMLGRPILKHGFIDMKRAAMIVQEMGERYGLKVNPYAITKDLPVGLQQRVEILKALYFGADILIMDEPTAVLTPQEIEQLFVTLKSLKEQGKTIILITHKLKELLSVTDEITVMRKGEITGRLNTKETTEQEIAKLMVGREVITNIPKSSSKPGRTVLSLKRVGFKDQRGVDVLKDITFDVHEGEIVGIAGVQGNGQTELIEVIAGLKDIHQGKIYLNQKELTNTVTPMERRMLGLGHIAEDRQTMGASLDASVLENFMMAGYLKSGYSNRWFINYKKVAEVAQEQLRRFDVRTSNIHLPVRSLSGGNLQKLIIAREMFLEPSLLIAAQPTRGVDIGASQFIHQSLIEMRNKGKGILLVSYELSEIMTLSDRILVLYNGSIVAETTPQETTEEEIGLFMAGLKKAEDVVN